MNSNIDSTLSSSNSPNSEFDSDSSTKSSLSSNSKSDSEYESDFDVTHKKYPFLQKFDLHGAILPQNESNSRPETSDEENHSSEYSESENILFF